MSKIIFIKVFINLTHLAVTDFTVTEPRSHVMTFSSALDQIYHAVFIQNPAKAYNYRAFTSQLTNAAWLACSVFMIATPPVLYICAR